MHDPITYSRYRPRYPAALFERLRAYLKKDAKVVDLGAGTGLSILSLIEAGISARFVAVERDSGMLKDARAAFPNERVQFIQAAAEQTGLPPKSVDAVVIASAYHWMDRPKVDAEILRILKPGGTVQIIEYQFPKAPEEPELNEWIRRQFNTLWRFPDQKPRGRLESLAIGLVPHFEKCLSVQNFAPGAESFDAKLTEDEFLGLIFSQARALSYTNSLPNEAARTAHRSATAQSIHPYFSRSPLLFRFHVAGVLLHAVCP